MSRLAHTTTHTGATKAATVTVMTAAVLIVAVAALLLRSLDGSEVLSAGTAARGDTSTKSSPVRDETQQWRDLAASGALACLGERAAARATAAMNTSVREARMRAIAASVDPRSATYAAVRSSLILIANQSYDTACSDKIEVALESFYADAMSRLGDRPSVWRGAVLGDLVAEQRYGHSRATFLRRCPASCRISGEW